MKRSFLFLQGVCSPFFGQLADRLAGLGHRIWRINFNAGDLLYWGGRPGSRFRGSLEELPSYLDEVYIRHEISDQILFGDCRPVHQPAVAKARELGIRTHAFEEGYFRPHWVTLERGGVNAHSPLPRDPDWYRRTSPRVPEYHRGMQFKSPFWKRAGHDVAYHAAGIANPLLFPSYQTHAPANAAVEYASYLRHQHEVRRYKRRDAALIEALVASGENYYLLPLQLSSDAQIRFHSPFGDMEDVMSHVMASFAMHAPSGSRLIVKNHPLEVGLVDHATACMLAARKYGLESRVDFLESGSLETLVQHARGTVTVNSTVGGVALSYGCPTIALSNPIYNLPGLTFQHGLDAFWTQSEKPDGELFHCFRNVVVHVAQVNGGFYCQNGISLAVGNSVEAITSEQSRLEALL